MDIKTVKLISGIIAIVLNIIALITSYLYDVYIPVVVLPISFAMAFMIISLGWRE